MLEQVSNTWLETSMITNELGLQHNHDRPALLILQTEGNKTPESHNVRVESQGSDDFISKLKITQNTNIDKKWLIYLHTRYEALWSEMWQ